MKHSSSRKGFRGAITSLLVVACVVAVSSGAMAANKLIVQDNAATPNDKFVVTDLGFIGSGTNAPKTALHVTSNYVSSSSILLHYAGNASYNRVNDPEMRFARNNDVVVNGGLAQKTDRLGFFSFGSMIGGTFSQSAGIFAEAAENHTASTHAGNLYFVTTAPNTLYAGERLTILSTGEVGIGTVNPSQKLEVNGGFRLNTAATKPNTCDQTVRGLIWFTQGGISAADTLEVCAKDISGNYAWRALY